MTGFSGGGAADDQAWTFIGTGGSVTVTSSSSYKTLMIVFNGFTDFAGETQGLRFNSDAVSGHYVWGRMQDTAKAGGRDTGIILGTTPSTFASSDRAFYRVFLRNTSGRKFGVWHGGMGALRLGVSDASAGPSNVTNGVFSYEDGGSNTPISTADTFGPGSRSISVWGSPRDIFTGST